MHRLINELRQVASARGGDMANLLTRAADALDAQAWRPIVTARRDGWPMRGRDAEGREFICCWHEFFPRSTWVLCEPCHHDEVGAVLWDHDEIAPLWIVDPVEWAPLLAPETPKPRRRLSAGGADGSE